MQMGLAEVRVEHFSQQGGDETILSDVYSDNLKNHLNLTHPFGHLLTSSRPFIR